MRSWWLQNIRDLAHVLLMVPMLGMCFPIKELHVLGILNSERTAIAIGFYTGNIKILQAFRVVNRLLIVEHALFTIIGRARLHYLLKLNLVEIGLALGLSKLITSVGSLRNCSLIGIVSRSWDRSWKICSQRLRRLLFAEISNSALRSIEI